MQFKDSLREISGITHVAGNRLLAVDDEHTAYYIIDFPGDNIQTKKLLFTGKDFEDIALVDSVVFILKSNGELLELRSHPGTDDMDVTEHRSLFNKCNAEGLVYDSTLHKLLVAFKELKGEGEYKYVYSFDITHRTYDTVPYMRLSLKEMENDLFNSKFERFSLDVHQRLKKEKTIFAPAGIAIHPHSRNIYILSAVNSLIAVYSPEKELLGVYTLATRKFPQPEGITFDQSGNLFISNEARKTMPSNILKFGRND